MGKVEASVLRQVNLAYWMGVVSCSFWAIVLIDSSLEGAGILPNLITRPDYWGTISAHEALTRLLFGLFCATCGVGITLLRFVGWKN